MSKAKHPLQPLEYDNEGVLRFKKNAIVRFLLDDGPNDMNRLAIMNFSQEDREQFAQLIGYSLSGFSELSYVSDETYNRAAKQKMHRTPLTLFGLPVRIVTWLKENEWGLVNPRRR